MADARRIFRGQRQKKRFQSFTAPIPRRERSKRRRLSGILPWTTEVRFDANAFINLEVDLSREQENSKKLRNPRNPSRIIVHLNGENPIREVENKNKGRNARVSNNNNNFKPDGSFNMTAWESSIRKKIEPVKAGFSEVNYMLDKGVPSVRGRNDGASPLALKNYHHPGKNVSSRISTDTAMAETICGFNTEFSIVLDVNSEDFGNRCKVARIGRQGGELVKGIDQDRSVPCNVIESEKVAGVSCKDPELRVMIPLLDDDNDEQEQNSQSEFFNKRPRKRTGLFQRRNEVLELDQYLDTHVIDRYMEKLWKRLPKDKKEHCTYLDCLWFTMYLEEAKSFKILKWIKAKRIFSKRYVFIPIVHWSHWNLLILCHFGEDFSSEERTPCMLLLDSLVEADPERLEPLIRKFLVEVHKGEGRQDSDKFIAKIPLLIPEVPQQTNGNDCGVFLLHFIDRFLKRAPENFSTSEGRYPYFLTKDWFKLHEIKRRRKLINDVLLKEQDGANQMITRRVSTRTKKLHGFLTSGCSTNWIDLSSAA